METITVPGTIAEQIKQETPRFAHLVNEVAKVVVGHTDILNFIICYSVFGSFNWMFY